MSNDEQYVSDHEKDIDSQDGGHVKPDVEDVERGEDFVWTNENTQQPGRSFQVPGNDTSGYVGVSPEYRNYGDPNLKPLMTEEDRIALHDAGGFTDDELVRAAKNDGGAVTSTNPTALGARAEVEDSDADKDDRDAADPEETEEEKAAREERERGADGRFLPKSSAGTDAPKL